MSPAPLAFLRGRSPPSTRTAHQNLIPMEDTHKRPFEIEFHIPTPAGTVTKQVFPLKHVGASIEPSFYRPPAHYHIWQDEHFTVMSGEGTWYLWGGKTVHLKTGDEIVVPAWKWHTFDITPESKEPLAVAYRYNKEYSEMEERFFRNMLSYFGDCQRAGTKPSVFQIMVFSMHNWMPIALSVPGPEWLDLVVSVVFLLVVGFIGEFLPGYKASYPEYYAEEKKVE